VRILGQTNTEAETDNLERLRHAGCEIVLGSVGEPEIVRGATEGADVVYHLAAAQHEAGRPDEHFRRVNEGGTTNVVEAAADAGVRRLVHGSTIGVYRAEAGTTVQDDSPTEPDNIYGVTKLAAERIVQAAGDRVPWTIIRISETYGPADRRLLKLFRGIRAGKYFHVGRGDNWHHPVYVDDLVRSFRLAAEAPAAVGETMVVPGYDAVTSRQMADTIADVLEVRRPRLTIPRWPLWTAAVVMEATLRPLGVTPPLHRRRMHFFIKSFRFTGETARAALAYEPAVPFAEGAARTARWYRDHGLL
jgi:nucleoside-diphosphate-sugar epimerase